MRSGWAAPTAAHPGSGDRLPSTNLALHRLTDWIGVARDLLLFREVGIDRPVWMRHAGVEELLGRAVCNQTLVSHPVARV